MDEGDMAGHPESSDYASIERYTQRLRLLSEIDRSILRIPSVEQIADIALGSLRQLVTCVRASVTLFDVNADEVILLATHGDGPLALQAGARAKLSRTFFLGGSSLDEPHIIEDLRNNPDAHPWVEAMRAEGVRGYVSLPLVTEGQVIGSLTFGLSYPGQPPAEALEIAFVIADQLAVAILLARLRERVQGNVEELEARVTVAPEASPLNEARFRVIFEAAPFGMLLVDRDGRLLQFNPAVTRVLGYSDEELRSMSLADFGASDKARLDLCRRFALLMGDRTQFYRKEALLRHKDGRTITAFLTAACVPAASEPADLGLIMMEDVTEERRTQIALIQAEREAITGHLGASLAHEINNPLQSIIGCLGLAEEDLPEGSEASRYLDVARAELHRVARTIARLRDLHQPTQSDQFALTDLNTLVVELLTLNEPKFGELGIKVVWQPSRRLPLLLVMPDRIRQVFLNLILNALDAMPNGGNLSVRTAGTRQPAGVRVTVRDTGGGMPPVVLARLFEPFYSTKKHGLGLGVFTSRSIVEQHGGIIEVRSRPGRGTTFKVWLPVFPPGRGPSSAISRLDDHK